MIRVLEVGPSPFRSKGGMATVIKEFLNDDLSDEMNISVDYYETYVDGNKIYRLFFCLFSFFKFLFCFRKYDIFHIHVASYGSTFRKCKYINFLKYFNQKIVLHMHGAEFESFFINLNNSKQEYIKNSFNKCDKIIVLSESRKEKIDFLLQNNKSIVIPNGISISNLKGLKDDFNNTIGNFLFLGRIGKRKGAFDLLKACNILKQKKYRFNLFMAGDGEINLANEYIKENKLEDFVCVKGWVDQTGKIDLLNKTSVLVLPSYNEGLPMAILEAMASKKVIISTFVGGIPEVVSEENGFLIKPGDIDGLVNTMIDCITNKRKVELMAYNSKNKFLNNFEMNIMHTKIYSLFKELISKEHNCDEN